MPLQTSCLSRSLENDFDTVTIDCIDLYDSVSAW